MLVVLFESETNDKVFLAHIGLIESKEGICCARKNFEILTSEKYSGVPNSVGGPHSMGGVQNFQNLIVWGCK